MQDTVSDYKTRMKEELTELQDRVTKLQKFLWTVHRGSSATDRAVRSHERLRDCAH